MNFLLVTRNFAYRLYNRFPSLSDNNLERDQSLGVNEPKNSNRFRIGEVVMLWIEVSKSGLRYNFYFPSFLC